MSWQREVIRACLLDPDGSREQLLKEFDEDRFDNDIHRWLFKDYLAVIGRDFPSKENLKLLLNKSKLDPNKKKEVYRYVLSIMSTYDEDETFDTILNLVKDGKRRQQLRDAAYAILEGLEEEKDTASIYDTFNQLSTSIAIDDGEEFVITNPLKDFAGRTSGMKQQYTGGRRLRFASDHVLSTFFPYGIAGGEMVGILAPTNAGKSLMVSDMSITSFLKSNLNVCYFNTENEEIVNNTRFDAQLNEVAYGDIYKGELDDKIVSTIDSRYKDYDLDSNVGSIRFVKVTPFKFNINTVIKAVKMVEDELNQLVDIIIIDTPEHQVPVGKVKDHWEKKAQVYYELKAYIAETKKIGMYTIQKKHDSRALFKKRPDDESLLLRPSPEEAAGSIEIAKILDHILSMSAPTQLDILKNRVRLWLVKARNMKLGDFPIDVFRDPSTLKLTYVIYSDDDNELEMDDVTDNPFGESTSTTSTNKKTKNLKGGDVVKVVRNKKGKY